MAKPLEERIEKLKAQVDRTDKYIERLTKQNTIWRQKLQILENRKNKPTQDESAPANG